MFSENCSAYRVRFYCRFDAGAGFLPTTLVDVDQDELISRCVMQSRSDETRENGVCKIWNRAQLLSQMSILFVSCQEHSSCRIIIKFFSVQFLHKRLDFSLCLWFGEIQFQHVSFSPVLTMWNETVDGGNDHGNGWAGGETSFMTDRKAVSFSSLTQIWKFYNHHSCRTTNLHRLETDSQCQRLFQCSTSTSPRRTTSTSSVTSDSPLWVPWFNEW